MAKRGPSAPSAARPKGTATAVADALNPSPKRTVSSAAKGGPAKSPKASTKKSSTDDVAGGLQVIFGENLRIARSKRGLRQHELAERTGLPQQYLSLIELGQQNVTLKTVELLAEVLGQDPSAMLCRPKGVREKK
jgi:ribosome-binding protein aMBF1 (putative translation factor)